MGVQPYSHFEEIRHHSVCIDFCDLKISCPRNNFPTPFIDECVGHEVLSFMDGFSRYHQTHIFYVDQLKTSFTSSWGIFAYWVMPFILKNVGAIFYHVMSYCFHNLVHIILSYLDDITFIPNFICNTLMIWAPSHFNVASITFATILFSVYFALFLGRFLASLCPNMLSSLTLSNFK